MSDFNSQGSFTVTGTYGLLCCCVATGEVLHYSPRDDEAEEYDAIGSFDIAEWRQTYPGEKLEGATIDILDIGYWDEDENYTPPEKDWRADYRQNIANAKAEV